jgi:predicted glycosyltransferase involved in capsule biosynthesis
MRNIITILIYLTRNFDTKIIVKEVDESSVYEREVLPVLKQALEPEWLECIHHVFEKSEEFTFHRTKILNDMLWMVDTPVVVNYDSDILLPLETYINATNMIAKGWVHPDVENGKPVKVIYPYGNGNYQFQCHVGDNEVTNFINSGFNFEYFNGHMRQWDAKYGFCQFFDTEEYKKLGGENENFVAYGYEDDERHFRFNLLSSVARIDDYVYHLEHGRTKNSWFNNPHCEDNKKLWEILKVKGKKSLIKYYEEVEYMKERNG